MFIDTSAFPGSSSFGGAEGCLISTYLVSFRPSERRRVFSLSGRYKHPTPIGVKSQKLFSLAVVLISFGIRVK